MTSLGAVEQALLEEIPSPGHDGISGLDLQRRLHQERGLAPAASWVVLSSLFDRSLNGLPLLTVIGNSGARLVPPADPYALDFSLTDLGVLQRDRKLPGLLMVGTLRVGGTVPPFDAARTLAATEAYIDGVHAPERLADVLGMPTAPDGSSCDGDVAALIRGKPARFTFRPQVEVAGDHTLVLTGMPTAISVTRIRSIFSPPPSSLRPGTPVRREVSDSIVALEPDPLDEWRLQARIMTNAPALEMLPHYRAADWHTVRLECQLPAPFATLVDDWSLTAGGEGSLRAHISGARHLLHAH